MKEKLRLGGIIVASEKGTGKETLELSLLARWVPHLKKAIDNNKRWKQKHTNFTWPSAQMRLQLLFLYACVYYCTSYMPDLICRSWSLHLSFFKTMKGRLSYGEY